MSESYTAVDGSAGGWFLPKYQLRDNCDWVNNVTSLKRGNDLDQALVVMYPRTSTRGACACAYQCANISYLWYAASLWLTILCCAQVFMLRAPVSHGLQHGKQAAGEQHYRFGDIDLTVIPPILDP